MTPVTAYRDRRRKGHQWRYSFEYRGRRYQAPRAFRTKGLANAAERVLRDRLQRAEAGIPDLTGKSPSFTRWAGVVYDYAVTREQLSDPASLDRNLRKMLQFWGERPTDPATRIPGAPYHDLTLEAPLHDGSWLLKFEEWMDGLALAGGTKNHLRSAASKCYRVAMLPLYRGQTGITANPFVGIRRDPPRRRLAVFTRAQLRAVLLEAPPFLRMAIRLAVLAPELRVSNIAALRWSHLDEALTWIRMGYEHKTARKTARPLVVPVTATLRAFLEHERQNQPGGCLAVVQRAGQPVTRFVIQDALVAACAAADVPYGRAEDHGVTFHSLRHTARTILAERDVSDAKAQEALGHTTPQMSAWYKHLAPVHKREPLEQLAADLGATLEEPSPGSAPPAALQSYRRSRRSST